LDPLVVEGRSYLASCIVEPTGNEWKVFELKVVTAGANRHQVPDKHVYDEIRKQLGPAVTTWTKKEDRMIRIQFDHVNNTRLDLETEKAELEQRLTEIDSQLDAVNRTRHDLLGKSLGVYV
jgi:hypothetical protein